MRNAECSPRFSWGSRLVKLGSPITWHVLSFNFAVGDIAPSHGISKEEKSRLEAVRTFAFVRCSDLYIMQSVKHQYWLEPLATFVGSHAYLHSRNATRQSSSSEDWSSLEGMKITFVPLALTIRRSFHRNMKIAKRPKLVSSKVLDTMYTSRVSFLLNRLDLDRFEMATQGGLASLRYPTSLYILPL